MECGGNACCQIPLTTNGQGYTTNQSKWDMSADGEYDYMCVSLSLDCWLPSGSVFCRWSRSLLLALA